MRAQEVLIEICIHYSLWEKRQKRPFLITPALHYSSQAPMKTAHCIYCSWGWKGGTRRGEDRVSWKNSQGSAHISFSKTKCLISLPAFTLLLFAPISGSKQLWDLEPIFFRALKCIGCLWMKWTSWTPNNKPIVQNRHRINQTATETQEKMQSKQTGLSHDSRGITGPHRSQPSGRDQTTKSLNILQSTFCRQGKCGSHPRSYSLTTPTNDFQIKGRSSSGVLLC